MGTFHDDLGALHGMTVVVELTGSRVAVGRYHEENDRRVLLHGADLHEDGEGGLTTDEFLRRAFDVGVWGKHRTLALPREEVESVRLLTSLGKRGQEIA